MRQIRNQAAALAALVLLASACTDDDSQAQAETAPHGRRVDHGRDAGSRLHGHRRDSPVRARPVGADRRR